MQERRTQSWTRPRDRGRALSLSQPDGSVTLSWTLYAQLMRESGWELDDPASAPEDRFERSAPHPLSLKALYFDGEPQPEDGGR